jgi:2-polyprenyl-3-methyl-5-hydroxy-6-metoxy-1,4-benzoquinol methylase
VTPEQFELFARIEQEHWWFVARRRIMRALLTHVTPPGDDRIVVDVGCGTGGNVASLAGEYRAIGLDQSAAAVEFARARFPGTTFHVIHDIADAAPYLARASAVLCMDVVEHVQDDAGFLACLVNALSPGAQLMLTVPIDMSLWSRHDETNHHFRRYAIPELAALWRELPVKQRLLSAFNARLFPIVKAARLVSLVRGRARGEADTDFHIAPRVVNATLERLFRGELGPLRDAIDTTRRPYTRGVSAIALLERTAV